jgi:hypothetical protein
MITIRSFDVVRDYDDACEWWRHHKWEPVPADHLSQIGFIAESDGIKLAAVWLYLTGTAFSLLEFFVANPEAPLKKKMKAMNELLEQGLATAKRCGAKSVFTSLKTKSLERLYVKHGFTVTDREMNNLLARV